MTASKLLNGNVYINLKGNLRLIKKKKTVDLINSSYIIDRREII